MDIVNKLPRYVLIGGFFGFMTISGIMLKGAYADLDATKTRAMATEQTVAALSNTVKKIEENQNTFQQKYDRNQEENQRVFRQILTAVKE